MAEQERDAPVPLLIYVNNILHPKFSNVEVFINNQQISNSNGLYAHKSYISNNFKGAMSQNKEVLHCERYDYEIFPDEIIQAPLSEPFLKRRMKMLISTECFMLYGTSGVDFSSAFKLLYQNVNLRLRLITAIHIFYMISDRSNVSLGIIDCSLYNRRIALKDDYHKKQMDMLDYIPVEFIFLELLAKTFAIPARQNQFILESIFNNAPVRWNALAIKINSPYTGS